MSQQPKPQYSAKATMRMTMIVLFVIAALVLAWVLISNIPSATSDGVGGVIGLLLAGILLGGVLLNKWLQVQRKLK